MKLKIYLASSWRNTMQQTAVGILREAGFDVYDFKNPEGATGFRWSEIDPAWKEWSPEAYRRALFTPLAERGFRSDHDAMKAAHIGVMLLPCGASAHLEAGYFIGAGKPLYILGQPKEPELMYRMASRYCINMTELLRELDEWKNADPNNPNHPCAHGCRYADEAWRGYSALPASWMSKCPHGFVYNKEKRT